MKRRIFAAAMVLCLMAGTSAFAQEKKMMPKEQWTPEQVAQKKTDMMTENLKLTQEQSKQVYDLNLQEAKNMQARRALNSTERTAWSEKMNGVLTPEQQQAWKQWQEKRKDGMKDKSCKGGGCDKAKECAKEIKKKK